MRYIHYGHNAFSKSEFSPIKNHNTWIKPSGGLWGSRPNSEFGWKVWCIDNNFRLERLRDYFCFTLTHDTRKLDITRPSDLEVLPKLPGSEQFGSSVFLDFEQISNDYDAVEVFLNGDLDFQSILCGWDCNSILILNPDVVRELPKFEYEINGTKLRIEDLACVSNYYQAACTAEYLIENYPEFDSLEKAMSVGYQVRDLMLLHGYNEAEGIDYVLAHNKMAC